MHCTSPEHQPQGHHVSKKGIFLCTFPLAGGQSSIPTSPFSRASDTDIYTKQCGPGARWTTRRLCPGVWGRDSPRQRT